MKEATRVPSLDLEKFTKYAMQDFERRAVGPWKCPTGRIIDLGGEESELLTLFMESA